MTLLGWYSLILVSLGTLSNIGSIGKPREPLSAGIVVASLVLSVPVIVYIALTLFR